MGHFDGPAAQVDAWLREAGLVVTASERAARSLEAAYHRARRAEGLTAWAAPRIEHWQSFVKSAWDEVGSDDRLVMNGLQEQAVWAQIVGASGQGTALLEAPRQRMAAMAMEAHALLCAYAPQFLNKKARGGWPADAGAFSEWLTEFEEVCRAGKLMSAARLPLELRLAQANEGARPPLLLAGFDRILPVQRQLFEAWGPWSEVAAGQAARETRLFEAADEAAELTACAQWCRQRLNDNPKARLLVVTQGIGQKRGVMERAFLRWNAARDFEFSLGVPRGQTALGRGARLVLRWLTEPLAEHELDWLFSTGQTTTDDAEGKADGEKETWALTGVMRALRRRGLERTHWTLDAFIAQRAGLELPVAWVARMKRAREWLAEFDRHPQSPLAWAELAPQLLEIVGWPGSRPLSSAEFQVLRRFQQMLDECASLGFDGRRMQWQEFLKILGRALDETLFAPESRDAAIQIAGPAESAGLTADAVWFLGADEQAWPTAASMHPLISFDVQRRYGMPHSSAQLDWDVAILTTQRLLRAAPEAYFSFAQQRDGVDMRPSRLAVQCGGRPEPLPAELAAPTAPAPVTEEFEDFSQVPLAAENVAGGAIILTSQSQCPFKAFATARLGAQGWEPAQPGLSPLVRGNLLHEVLHTVWAGAPAGIRTHAELAAIADLSEFVAGHVGVVLRNKLPAAAREQMPQRYLALEELRLTALVTEWLEFERARVPFDVARTELDATRSIAGLTLKLRLDRIDRLSDRLLLVIDYKTGDVSAKAWKMPRPDDLQLPLYAGFGLDKQLRAELERESGSGGEDEAAGGVGGLVFAKIRTGDMCFAGRVTDARATLRAELAPASALVKRKFTEEEMDGWRDYIEQMAREFVAGRAEADPREYPKTCERCDLQALCRIEENRPDADDGEEAGDE